MEEKKMVFVSNYINHHQIPFCEAMYGILKGSFLFIQTEPMEQERVKMGWKEQTDLPCLKRYYEEPEECRRLIDGARVVLFGGCDEESYVQERLEKKKPVIRYSERLYKAGQWKAVSPRGLRKKYYDHTRHRKDPVYLLCAGGYVASDFHIVRAYPGKMYCWGYFPETRYYDLEALLEKKGWPVDGETGKEATVFEESGVGKREEVPEEDHTERNVTAGQACGTERARHEKKLPYLLWAARMIDWKHPELAMETARYLKEKGLSFHMDMIGGGDRREALEAARSQYGLEDCVGLPGAMTPEQVRAYMERADIFLFTSDRREGWGAVANEAMNSGCALIADHMIGAAPFLIQNGENGLIYRDGARDQLFALAERLVRDRSLCRELGKRAYRTITEEWNAKRAAERLTLLCVKLGLLKREDLDAENVGELLRQFEERIREKDLPGPCVPARVISERRGAENAGRRY